MPGAVFTVAQLVYMSSENLLENNPLYVWFLAFTVMQGIICLLWLIVQIPRCFTSQPPPTEELEMTTVDTKK